MTPLHALRVWFDGNDLNEDIIDYVERGAPRAELDALRHHYRQHVESQPAVPPRPGFELRPYVSTLWQDHPAYASGIAGSYARDFRHRDDVATTINALKHFLLYCHSIAIDNPLVLYLDMLSLGASERSVAIHRVHAANVLRLLMELRDLIDRHVVVFVEPRDRIHNLSVALLSSEHIVDVANTVDFSDLRSFYSAPIESQNDRLISTYMGLKSLTYGLLASRELEGAVNIHLPFKHSEALLNKFISTTAAEAALGFSSGQKTQLQNGTADLQYLRHLLSLQVPTFDRLSTSDILAIRAGDRFIQLRQGLEQGLRELGSVEASGPTHAQHVRKIFTHTLEHSRESLEADVKRSPAMRASLKGLRNLAVAGVPTVIAADLGGATAAAAAFVFTEATQLGMELFHQRKDRAAAQAYAAHALLFQPDRI
jgi:hypothetical protein